MHLRNFTIAFKNIALGKSISSASSLISYEHFFRKIILPKRKPIFVDAFLCGFPRTGTHWILNVMNKSTGIPVYELAKKTEISDQRLLMVKIHARNIRTAKLKAFLALPPYIFGKKFIYVYRDPRDAIISLYEMYKFQKRDDTLNQKSFLKLCDPVGQYKWEIDSWVKSTNNNILKVKFEELKTNPEEGFKKILNFLDVNSELDKRIIDKKVYLSAKSKRPRASVNGWKDPDNQIVYKTIINEVNLKLSQELKFLDYEH
jgi:hypothetical protein